MNAISKRQTKEKDILVEKLKITPIVQVACQKSGVGRATYYRWKKEDKKFSKQADDALSEGRIFVNDMAESQLLQAIKDQKMTAIIFWLRSHHPAYSQKVEVNAKLKMDKDTLTKEQEDLVRNALNLAGLLTTNNDKGESKNEN